MKCYKLESQDALPCSLHVLKIHPEVLCWLQNWGYNNTYIAPFLEISMEISSTSAVIAECIHGLLGKDLVRRRQAFDSLREFIPNAEQFSTVMYTIMQLTADESFLNSVNRCALNLQPAAERSVYEVLLSSEDTMRVAQHLRQQKTAFVLDYGVELPTSIDDICQFYDESKFRCTALHAMEAYLLRQPMVTEVEAKQMASNLVINMWLRTGRDKWFCDGDLQGMSRNRESTFAIHSKDSLCVSFKCFAHCTRVLFLFSVHPNLNRISCCLVMRQCGATF